MAAESSSDAAPPDTLGLSATYSSPANAPFTLSQQLPTLADDSVTARTGYLAALRQAVVSAQEQINKELTARMADDKAAEAAAADSASVPTKKRKPGVDESKEEENYGEEVVGEDG